MNELFFIDAIDDTMSVFGSLKILEDSEPLDQLSIINFAKIVNNYIKMSKILNQ